MVDPRQPRGKRRGKARRGIEKTARTRISVILRLEAQLPTRRLLDENGKQWIREKQKMIDGDLLGPGNRWATED
jgi:hypothetical protein